MCALLARSGTQKCELGGLDFSRFNQCLLRCALAAYGKMNLPPVQMLKALLYYMSTAVHVAKLTVPGAKLLQQRAKQLWIHDGKGHYLSAPRVERPSGDQLMALAFEDMGMGEEQEQEQEDYGLGGMAGKRFAGDDIDDDFLQDELDLEF